jgi:hypothetical protein
MPGCGGLSGGTQVVNKKKETGKNRKELLQKKRLRHQQNRQRENKVTVYYRAHSCQQLHQKAHIYLEQKENVS